MHYGQYGNCGCHNVPQHQCPGPMPGNQTVQGITVTCVGCPVVSTVLTTSQLIAGNVIQAGSGQLHYNPQTGLYTYALPAATPGGAPQIITLATTDQLAQLAASIPTAQQIQTMVNAALTSANILNLIDCTALKSKCGFLQATDLDDLITTPAGSGITITVGAGGALSFSLTGGGAGGSGLTAAQIQSIFQNVVCADLTAALTRCNLCTDSVVFGSYNPIGGNAAAFYVSGYGLPATILFQETNGTNTTVNTVATGAVGSGGQQALHYVSNNGSGSGPVQCRYSLDGGTTWSAWATEIAPFNSI